MKRLTVRLSESSYKRLMRQAIYYKRSVNQQVSYLIDLKFKQVDLSMPPESPSELRQSDVTMTSPTNEYVIPDWKTDPVPCLVISFKTLKGVPHDDRAWDKIHFARNAGSAKKLLQVCGDFQTADRCLVAISTGLNEKGFSWTFETILKHAHDWLAKERKTPNGTDHRQRLFKHLHDRRTTPGLSQAGIPNAARTLLDRIRDSQGVPAESPDSGARGRSNDGPSLPGLQAFGLEATGD